MRLKVREKDGKTWHYNTLGRFRVHKAVFHALKCGGELFFLPQKHAHAAVDQPPPFS
jgi:hypothetical protein